MPDAIVHELRVVLTVEDFDASVRVYRDVLGMHEVPAVSSPGGRVAILEAGRATLELAEAAHVRVALGVPAVAEQSQRLEGAGLTALAPPTMTPFGTTNARFETPDGLQLTLFG